MPRVFLVRIAVLMTLGCCAGVSYGFGQSTVPSQPSIQTPSQTPSQSDNPFPEDAPKPATQGTSQGTGQQAKPGDAKQDPGKPKTSDNPFPGEDPNAPIIPVAPGPGSGADSRSSAPRTSQSDADSGSTSRRDADPDGDPVRSPDGAANETTDDGFSSSRSGLKQIPVEDDNDGKPGKSTKNKTREEVVKEDLDVGSFYMDKKNWKAAQSRFSAAFALDSENPDVVWGLAEAERHLDLYKDAAEHYKLFLSYEPDGRRGKEARKALEEVMAAPQRSSTAVPRP